MKLIRSLIYINALSLLISPFVLGLLQNTLISAVLGVFFVLFAPGYVLVAALFPRSSEISNAKRLIFSFGISLVIVPFIGLILNYTLPGVRIEPVYISLAGFILVTSFIAWFRIRKSHDPQSVKEQATYSVWSKGWIDLTFSILMIGSLVACLAVAINFFDKPRLGEVFTQFYVVPSNNNQNFTQNLQLGENEVISLVLVNREKNTVTYRIETKINGVKNGEIGAINLESEQTWKRDIVMTPTERGDNIKLEFILYREQYPEPYLDPLYVWVNVK